VNDLFSKQQQKINLTYDSINQISLKFYVHISKKKDKERQEIGRLSTSWINGVQLYRWRLPHGSLPLTLVTWHTLHLPTVEGKSIDFAANTSSKTMQKRAAYWDNCDKTNIDMEHIYLPY
jgi:hypothetical protein